MDKKEAYAQLVSERKACSLCHELNKAKINFKNQWNWPQFDKNEIGNWTSWANNLDADVVIVGQDYSNQEVFIRDSGVIEPKENFPSNPDKRDYTTITNFYLRELTKLLNRDIGIPTQTSSNRIFLTNAVLCLKSGPMNASIPSRVLGNCALKFLKRTIEIIQPKAIIALGHMATLGTIRAFEKHIDIDKSLLSGSFSNLFRNGSLNIKTTPNTKIFPVFHPGLLGQSNRAKILPRKESGWDLQKKDWLKIHEYLNDI